MNWPDPTILIKKMELDDLSDVKKLEVETGLSPWSLADYAEEIENKDSQTLVMVKASKSKIIGFLAARLIIKGQISPNLSSPIRKKTVFAEFEILNICLGKEFQNQGLGQKLLDGFLEIVSKDVNCEIWLEVRESNAMALKFYKKNGFVLTGIRKAYYQKPTEDALIMKLSVIREVSLIESET